MNYSTSVLAFFSGLILVSGCGIIHIQERPPTGLDEERDFGPSLKEIRIEGLGYTRERTVLQQLSSRVGRPYTKEIAYKDFRNLHQLKIFSSIHFAVEPDGEGVILIVTVTEVNPYTPSIKIGITDENGVSFGFGGSSANLLGTANKANASVNFGGQSGVKLGLSSPWRAGRLLMYDLKFSWQIRDNHADNFRENALEITSLAQRNIGRNFRAGAFFDFYSIGSDTTGITLSDKNRDNVPRLGAFVGIDSRKFPSRPDERLVRISRCVEIRRLSGRTSRLLEDQPGCQRVLVATEQAHIGLLFLLDCYHGDGRRRHSGLG